MTRNDPQAEVHCLAERHDPPRRCGTWGTPGRPQRCIRTTGPTSARRRTAPRSAGRRSISRNPTIISMPRTSSDALERARTGDAQASVGPRSISIAILAVDPARARRHLLVAVGSRYRGPRTTPIPTAAPCRSRHAGRRSRRVARRHRQPVRAQGPGADPHRSAPVRQLARPVAGPATTPRWRNSPARSSAPRSPRRTFPPRCRWRRPTLESAKAMLVQRQADFNRQKSLPRQATTQQDVDAATAEFAAGAGQCAARPGARRAGACRYNRTSASRRRKSATNQAGTVEHRAGEPRSIEPQPLLHGGAGPAGTAGSRDATSRWAITSRVGQQIFNIVSPDVWVTANFKETQLNLMRPGQAVKDHDRRLSEPRPARPRRFDPTRLRLEILRLPGRERDRQFRQDRPARAREDHHRFRARSDACRCRSAYLSNRRSRSDERGAQRQERRTERTGSRQRRGGRRQGLETLVQPLAHRRLGDARRVHGDPRHDDRQRGAAAYRRLARRLERRGDLRADLLPHRQRHRAHGIGLHLRHDRPQALLPRLPRHVHSVLVPVRRSRRRCRSSSSSAPSRASSAAVCSRTSRPSSSTPSRPRSAAPPSA